MNDLRTTAKEEWNKIYEEMRTMPGFQRLMHDKLNVEHYKSVLRQIYLQTRDNPSVQAAASLRFHGVQRDIIRKFMGHALSEVGHDQLALGDLETLGEDISDLPSYRPLPGTAAMKAFAYQSATAENPCVYFGYLYHLESMPVKSGASYIQRLVSLGVPEEALSFIEEHSRFDVAHMKLNEEYLNVFVKTEEDLEDFIYGMRTAAILYARMLEDAFAAADKKIATYHINAKESRQTSLSLRPSAVPFAREGA